MYHSHTQEKIKHTNDDMIFILSFVERSLSLNTSVNIPAQGEQKQPFVTCLSPVL